MDHGEKTPGWMIPCDQGTAPWRGTDPDTGALSAAGFGLLRQASRYIPSPRATQTITRATNSPKTTWLMTSKPYTRATDAPKATCAPGRSGVVARSEER